LIIIELTKSQTSALAREQKKLSVLYSETSQVWCKIKHFILH